MNVLLTPLMGPQVQVPSLPPIPRAPQNPDSITALPDNWEEWHWVDKRLHLQGASPPPAGVKLFGPPGDAMGGTGRFWEALNSLEKEPGPAEGVLRQPSVVFPPPP
jgi:hypothetical protein